MAREHDDYVYRLDDDSFRFHVFKREIGDVKKPWPLSGWDYDVWERVSKDLVCTFTTEVGESPFRTKRDLLAHLREKFGKLVAVNLDKMTEGW